MTNPIVLVFGWLSVIGGTQVLLGVFWTRRKLRESRRWPAAAGQIVSSEVVRQVQGRPPHLYVARIEYEYTVDRQQHRGTRISLGGELNTSSRYRAEFRCRKYPVGAAVEVYYDPIKPDDSCLERTGESLWFALAVSAIFLLVGLFIVTGAAGNLAAWLHRLLG